MTREVMDRIGDYITERVVNGMLSHLSSNGNLTPGPIKGRPSCLQLASRNIHKPPGTYAPLIFESSANFQSIVSWKQGEGQWTPAKGHGIDF